MRVVLDANVVAAALVRPDGWTRQQLRRPRVVWLAPRNLVDELVRHEESLAARSGLTRQAWRARVRRFLPGVTMVEAEALESVRLHPFVRAVAAVDPDDAPYAAALVAGHADFIWTRDKSLLRALPRFAVLELPG